LENLKRTGPVEKQDVVVKITLKCISKSRIGRRGVEWSGVEWIILA
jgi:hypothetical protein